MTVEGVEKLISYQRSHYAKEWRYNMKAADVAEVTLAYADALEDYEDQQVLRAYLGNLKRWPKMPSIAEIMTAADGIKRRMEAVGAADGFRCRRCGLPWNRGEGYHRETMPRRGQSRCPECNAILDGELPPEGFVRADNVRF